MTGQKKVPFSKGRYLWNSGNTLLKFKNLLLQSPTRSISTRLGTTHPLVKVTKGFTIRTIQLSKRRWWDFFSPNQHYDIIIALSKCVYWFELVSQVSNVAHGPLVQTRFPMAILLTISMLPVTGLELRGTTLCSSQCYLLQVCSSGAIRYVPLYFIPSDEIQNAQYHQPAPPTLNGNILSPIARHT